MCKMCAYFLLTRGLLYIHKGIFLYTSTSTYNIHKKQNISNGTNEKC